MIEHNKMIVFKVSRYCIIDGTILPLKLLLTSYECYYEQFAPDHRIAY